MNTAEKEDAIRVAPILRAGRKLSGLTQQQMSAILGISQGALSKTESAAIVPSISMWFRFCQSARIDPAISFKAGYIDSCKVINSSDEHLSENVFRIPKEYSLFPYTGVRSLKPFKHYFIQKLGERRFNDFCKSKKVDPDLFVVCDQRINMGFTIEFLSHLSAKGGLNKTVVDQIAKGVANPLMHGEVHNLYDGLDNQFELYHRWIKSMDLYERDHDFKIEESNSKKLVLSVTPRKHLNNFEYKDNGQLGNFFCEYRKSSITQFSTYINKPVSKVTETNCFFRGSHQCTYKITEK